MHRRIFLACLILFLSALLKSDRVDADRFRKIWILNNTGSRISVLIRFNSETGQGDEPSVNGWKTRGWWNVDPGVKQLIIDRPAGMANANFYLHVSRDGRTLTRGTTWPFDGQNYDFNFYDAGTSDDFTVAFD